MQAELRANIRIKKARLRTLRERYTGVGSLIDRLNEDPQKDLKKLQKCMGSSAQSLASAIQGSSGINSAVTEMQQEEGNVYGLASFTEESDFSDERYRLATEMADLQREITDDEYRLANTNGT